jgi:hypothetical protein
MDYVFISSFLILHIVEVMHLESTNLWTIMIFRVLQQSDYDTEYGTQFTSNIKHLLFMA